METQIEQKKAKIEETIKKIVGFMDLECRIEFREEDKEGKVLFASIYTPENARLLIGKNGQTLKALEHVIRLLLPEEHEPAGVLIDINDYRKSRTNYLMDLARQAVGRVRNTQKAEALVPMTPYERRVVHMELASCPDITTESIGEEPHRRVVIKPFVSTI